MQNSTVVTLHLPPELAASIRTKEIHLTDEQQVKRALAVGLFVIRRISLAKAASLAGMSRYEFAHFLKRTGLPAYEYAEADYQDDLAFAASVSES